MGGGDTERDQLLPGEGRRGEGDKKGGGKKVASLNAERRMEGINSVKKHDEKNPASKGSKRVCPPVREGASGVRMK